MGELDPLLVLAADLVPASIVVSFIAAYVLHVIDEEMQLWRLNRKQ